LQNLLFPLRALQTARRWRRLPVVGALVESFLFARLAFLFEIAVVFIEVTTPHGHSFRPTEKDQTLTWPHLQDHVMHRKTPG
jgi:hypothetical protein